MNRARVLEMSNTFKIDVVKVIDKKDSYDIKLRQWNGYNWDSITFETWGDRNDAITIAENLSDFINNNKIRSHFSSPIHIE